MILKEIKKILSEHKSKTKVTANPNFKRKEFGGLKGSEVLQIITVAAQVQALEETITCITDQGFKGSSYRDLIDTAAELDFNDKQLAAVEAFKPHLPFFIPSLGPHLVNVIDTYLSTKYFKEKNRVSPRDRDMFFSYYRTSTGIGHGLGSFSALNKDINAITEVLKTVLGFPDACNTTMPQHLSFPTLGLKTESSAVAAQVNIAACSAMALGALYRSEEMPYSEDSIVNLMVGDSGTNEPSFVNSQKMIRRHMYQIARHFLDETEIENARYDDAKKKKLFEKIRDIGVGLRFAVHIFDNKIGISCPVEVSHSWGDPLHDYLWSEKDAGIVKIFRYDSLDFLDVLQQSVKIIEEARRGPVIAHIQIIRPGGHSLSNYYGLSMIPESAKSSPLSSLTLNEALYHNNNDPVLNAVKEMVDMGYLTPDGAVILLESAQKVVIERYIELIPKAKKSLPKTELIPVMAYDYDSAQTEWEKLVQKKPERDRLWKNGHLQRISRTPGLRFKIEDGQELPEDLNDISPIQAENFSLADILMLSDTFRAVGEDIPDTQPDFIEEVLKNPGSGTGGINKATSGLQVLSHINNPQTGRYHITDIGIDEAGIYALAAGFSHALDGKGFVMAEIQFNDYDFGLFAPEEISSLYQRSNGKASIPVVIRQSYGFVRGRTIESVFAKGGAAGTYHSSCTVGSIANRFKGLVIVITNTVRAVQTAYRNAVSGKTPTIILMSNPVMRKIAIGSFPYSGKYLPLETPLDPLGTYYKYSASGDPVGAHNHIILTYGEYVPICYMIAEQLLEKGIKTLVVDYNYIVPRNKNVVEELLTEYRTSAVKPKFTVVSQESDFGFGDLILNDLGIHRIYAAKLCAKERRNQWLSESLTFPTPEQISNHILNLHREQVAAADGFAYDDVPREQQPMEQYFSGF